MTQPTQTRAMQIGVMPAIGEGSMQGQTPRFADIRAMAQAAESATFDSFWLADHLLYRFPGEEEHGAWEVFTFLSALAASTSRIALGPLVACTSFRNPALLAKMADSLDEISAGRFLLGLGAGWHEPEYAAYGYPFDHLASRFEEALSIIAPLLHGERVSLTGQYYTVNDVVLRPHGPSRKGPPIWIGASKPRMLRAVARYADAYNTVWHKSPDEFTERVALLRKACEEVGRNPDEILLTAGTTVLLPGPGEAADPNGRTLLSGSPEEIAMALHAFATAGVKHLVVVPQPNTVATIERLGHVVELLDRMG